MMYKVSAIALFWDVTAHEQPPSLAWTGLCQRASHRRPGWETLRGPGPRLAGLNSGALEAEGPSPCWRTVTPEAVLAAVT